MRKSIRGKELPFVHPFTAPASAAAFEALCAGMKKFNPELPESVAYDVASYCKHVVYPRNALLLDYGEMFEYVYFLIRGLVTSLEKVEGREHYNWFVSEGEVIIDGEESRMQARSRQKLVALAETECLVLHADDLQLLREKHPTFVLTELKLTRQHYMQAINRTKLVRMDATQKYQMLKEGYPKIVANVTVTALASFLGVSRKHLSAIMARDASK